MLRALVAQDKYVLSANGTTLDLTYILPNLVAMGVPATGLTKQWRNSRDEIAAYFKARHPGNYMVWNLTEKPYSSDAFEYRVQHVGFLDHHPPRFNHLLKLVGDIVAYLRADKSHVAAVHCRAGRGRTGMVCACVLLGLGICSDARDALRLFAQRRSKIAKGSTSPPQIRYVYNFWYYLHTLPPAVPYTPLPDFKLRLRSISFVGFEPVLASGGLDRPRPVVAFAALSMTDPKPVFFHFPQRYAAHGPGAFTVSFDDQTLQNDVVVFVSAETPRRTVLLGRIVLNPFFVDEAHTAVLGIDKMMDPTEGANRNEFLLPPTFRMRFVFAPADNEPDADALHRTAVAFVSEHPYDTIHKSTPPALPPKIVTPPATTSAPPLPPKPVPQDLLLFDPPPKDVLLLDVQSPPPPTTPQPGGDLLLLHTPAQPAPLRPTPREEAQPPASGHASVPSIL